MEHQFPSFTIEISKDEFSKNILKDVFDVDLNNINTLLSLSDEDIERYDKAGLLTEAHWEIINAFRNDETFK